MGKLHKVHLLRFTNHELGVITRALDLAADQLSREAPSPKQEREIGEWRRLAARIATRDRDQTTLGRKETPIAKQP